MQGKLYFILSLIGILLLILLSQTTQETQTGTIKSIQYSENKITIHLEDRAEELIVFEADPLYLKKGDVIEFKGRADTYRGKNQIIVDKISLHSQ